MRRASRRPGGRWRRPPSLAPGRAARLIWLQAHVDWISHKPAEAAGFGLSGTQDRGPPSTNMQDDPKSGGPPPDRHAVGAVPARFRSAGTNGTQPPAACVLVASGDGKHGLCRIDCQGRKSSDAYSVGSRLSDRTTRGSDEPATGGAGRFRFDPAQQDRGLGLGMLIAWGRWSPTGLLLCDQTSHDVDAMAPAQRDRCRTQAATKVFPAPIPAGARMRVSHASRPRTCCSPNGISI